MKLNKQMLSAKTAATILLLAFVAVIWAAAPKSAANLTGGVVSARKFADASTNYAKYCSRCHGGDGRGQTAKGKQTNATDLTKSRIATAGGVRIISGGKGQMPGYRGNMSDAEISELMNFVRGFRQ